jgi:8-oxo-dGTP diphosphatase
MWRALKRAFSMVEELDKFGRKLPSRQGGYYVPSLTTDAVVLRPRAEGGHDILMITRGRPPFLGCLAFPGGFVDYNEDPIHGCIRELEEECGIAGTNPRLITVRGDPQRDPRGHMVSIVYRIDVAPDAQAKAGDDAATASFYPLTEVLSDPSRLAFDHYSILQEVAETLTH